MEKLVALVIKFLVENILSKALPANIRPYLSKLEQVLPLVAEAIEVANLLRDADNGQKKRVAAEHLLSLLKDANLDIPGDADLQVCEVLVEGVYQALKSFKLAK